MQDRSPLKTGDQKPEYYYKQIVYIYITWIICVGEIKLKLIRLPFASAEFQ